MARWILINWLPGQTAGQASPFSRSYIALGFKRSQCFAWTPGFQKINDPEWSSVRLCLWVRTFNLKGALRKSHPAVLRMCGLPTWIDTRRRLRKKMSF